MRTNRFIIPSLIMGLAILISTIVFSGTWRKVKSENQTINVTGSAKQVIVSDLGILRGTLSGEGAT
ncbi:MAG: SIMPL domain-containing protein, partial [Daejeonella sp.]